MDIQILNEADAEAMAREIANSFRSAIFETAKDSREFDYAEEARANAFIIESIVGGQLGQHRLTHLPACFSCHSGQGPEVKHQPRWW